MKCHKDYVGYESRTPWLVSKPIANSSAVSPPMTLQTVTACDLLALPVTFKHWRSGSEVLFVCPAADAFRI